MIYGRLHKAALSIPYVLASDEFSCRRIGLRTEDGLYARLRRPSLKLIKLQNCGWTSACLHEEYTLAKHVDYLEVFHDLENMPSYGVVASVYNDMPFVHVNALS